MHDISSTSDHVVLELEKDEHRTTLELGSEEARALVAGDEVPSTQRVPASGTR